MSIVNSSIKASLAIQAITGLVGLYGLGLPLAPKDIILKEVLSLELIVQLVEFLFYSVFVFVTNIKFITEKRYYDWFMSTPVMLFTISLYFFYVNFQENTDNKEHLKKHVTLVEFTKQYSTQIIGFVLLNFLMLAFGFLAELGFIDRGLAFVLGTGALCGSFGIIYQNFAKFSEKTRNIFWIMFGLWSMYGVAFLFPPVAKNVSYTALDIFAKNFFGIFLFFMIRSKTI